MQKPKDARSIRDMPNVLCQKLPAEEFEVTAKLTLHSQKPGTMAGLVMLGVAYAYVAITKTETGFSLRFCMADTANEGFASVSSVPDNLKPRDGQVKGTDLAELVIDGPVLKNNGVIIAMRMDKDARCRFSWSSDGKIFSDIGQLFFARPGRWVGARLGLFALSERAPKTDPAENTLDAQCTECADFKYFHVRQM
ncbi:MAG: hypothetical protein EHM28_06235 [Spirochaetaceae bacterium]|nr:MAG: hypothetical protein EHM28_06235 [Spirochaetaceae bacterium]